MIKMEQHTQTNLDEAAKEFIEKNCKFTIKEDLFSNSKQIYWKCRYIVHGLEYEKECFQLRYIPDWFRGDLNYIDKSMYVKLINAKEQFVIQYNKKEFSTRQFKNGDAFHFVFANGVHLEFLLKKPSSNTNSSDYKQVSFSILPKDIELFATQSVTAIRCTFLNGDAPLELYPENEMASLSFKLYFQKYKQALLECGVDIESRSFEDSMIEEVQKDEPKRKDSSCFVYLMKDVSNGFYKIGISNKPEYRERTLQSEKPTIVLLKSKEFPTRIIAEAIESALHKAFGEKRLRGEWFELDEKDVEDIIITLS